MEGLASRLPCCLVSLVLSLLCLIPEGLRKWTGLDDLLEECWEGWKGFKVQGGQTLSVILVGWGGF